MAPVYRKRRREVGVGLEMSEVEADAVKCTVSFYPITYITAYI